MTPLEVLVDLLTRVGASREAAALVVNRRPAP